MSSKPPVSLLPPDDPDIDGFGEPSPSGRTRGRHRLHLAADLLGRWYWLALGLVLGGLGALYYLSKAPVYYTATTTMAITMPSRGMMPGGGRQDEQFDTSTVEGLNTIAARLARAELLKRVAARPDVLALRDLAPPPVDWRPAWWIAWTGDAPATANPQGPEARSLPQAVIARMIGSWMRVSVREKTRLLDLSVKHRVPEVAKTVANAIAAEYVAEAQQYASEDNAAKSSTLLRQSNELSAKLAETNSALGTYARAIQIHAELEAQENAYAQLSLRYRPRYPDMVEARGKLENTKNRFLAELGIAMNSPLDADYWKTAGAAIEAAQDDPEAHLKAARQALFARISVLNATAKSQETLLQSMSTSSTIGNVDRETLEVSIRVDSKAQTPSIPSEPSRNRVLVTGSGTGLAAGMLLALFLGRLDNKFRSVAQLEEEAETPVLAAVANISLRHLDRAVASARKRGKAVEPNPLQQTWDPRLLFRPGLSSTTYCETFRVLRASVSLLGDESRRRITLFTSALPGEGKSLVSANFALAAAAQGRKTLLIDLDLRKPRQHRIFGVPRKRSGKPGATEWCAARATLEQAVVTDTGAPNLHIVFSGARAPNPGELLNAERLREMLDEARNAYDVIVIDSAPLLAVPDTSIIAAAVDNLCLVVRANRVPKGAVLRTLDLLDSFNTPPSGLVFNGFDESRRRIGQNYSYGNYRLSYYGKAYRYGYGSYGSYGTYGADDDDDEDDEDDDSKATPRKAVNTLRSKRRTA